METLSGFPAQLMSLPNLLSLSRIPLGGAFWLVLGATARSSIWAFAVMGLAALTDVLDGYLARRQAQRAGSPPELDGGTGAWLDPICDKIFVGAVLAAIIVRRHPPPMVISLVLTRELVQLPLGVVYRFVPALRSWLRYDFRASLLGKAATIAQFLAIVALILDHPSIAISPASPSRWARRAGRLHEAGRPDRQERSRARPSRARTPSPCNAKVPAWALGSPKRLRSRRSGGAVARGVAQRPAAPVTPPAATAEAGMRNEKVREELQLAPWDLAFSAVRGTGAVTETVTARNLTDEPVTVRALPVLGDGSAPFELRNPPKLPAIVPPKGQLSVEVTFAPPATAALGVHRALLRFQTGATSEDGPGTDLVGAGDAGPRRRAGTVAGRSGRGARLRDRRARRCAERRHDGGGHAARRRGGGAAVHARDADPGGAEPGRALLGRRPRPFGHYTLKSAGKDATKDPIAVPQTLATLAEGQHQTLNPELEAGGAASFDPGAAVFGLWVRAGKRTIYRRIVATAAPTSTQHGSSRCARAAARRRRTRISWRFAMRPTARFRTTCSCSGTSSR